MASQWTRGLTAPSASELAQLKNAADAANLAGMRLYLSVYPTGSSQTPLEDADRLLARFLPRAFRRPVDPEVRAAYLALVDERLKTGDCFEFALRYAYRAALCSPDFLYHIEPTGPLDDEALACRLSDFLWN